MIVADELHILEKPLVGESDNSIRICGTSPYRKTISSCACPAETITDGRIKVLGGFSITEFFKKDAILLGRLGETGCDTRQRDG